MVETGPVLLFEHPLSPYAQKVKLALLEKQVPFETVNLATMTDAERIQFVTWNPRAEVPVLTDNGFAIYDSTVILQYIEERWPSPELLPAAPQDRARVRMLEEIVDTHFEANTWGLSEVIHFGRATDGLASALIDYGVSEIRQWLAWLNVQLGDRRYFNGAKFGWGDLCVVPFVNGATRFDVYPLANTPLAEWLQTVNERPHVIACKQAAEAWELDPALMAAALESGFKREYRDHRVEWMIRAGGLQVVADGLKADNLRFNAPFPTPE